MIRMTATAETSTGKAGNTQRHNLLPWSRIRRQEYPVADTQNTLPTHIDVFIDFVCPWCYLAHQAVNQLQQKRSVDVQWHPFPLHPETPQEGLSISTLFGGADLGEVHSRLYALMDET